jgi:hypothetical protein
MYTEALPSNGHMRHNTLKFHWRFANLVASLLSPTKLFVTKRHEGNGSEITLQHSTRICYRTEAQEFLANRGD